MDQISALVSRNDLLAVTLNISMLYKIFNGVGSGGRCAKSLFLRIFVKIFCTCVFHGREKRIFGKCFWRRCKVFWFWCLCYKVHTVFQIGQTFFIAFFWFSDLTVQCFPAGFQDSFAWCSKIRIFTAKCYFYSTILICRSWSTKQTECNEFQDILFTCCKSCNITFHAAFRWNNRMMSCDFVVIDDCPEIRFCNTSKPKMFADCRNESIGSLFHIIG